MQQLAEVRENQKKFLGDIMEAREEYANEGNFADMPGRVKLAAGTINYKEADYNAYWQQQQSEVTDGPRSGLGHIKSIIQALESEVVFDVSGDGEVSPLKRKSSILAGLMPSGSTVDPSAAGGYQNMVNKSKKLIFELKTMDDVHKRMAPGDLDVVEEIDEPHDIEKQVDPKQVTLDFADSSPLAGDCAFQLFAARKATIVKNIQQLADARQDLDENAKKNLVQQAEQALEREQALFVKIRAAVDEETRAKVDQEVAEGD